MVKISVIVPVYKVEKYLGNCIDSILAQSFSDFELILVDDGSPDCCGGICDQYSEKDDRIRVVHQENLGLSGARNTGIELSVGEYITFIDSDDLVSPNYLEYLFSLLVDNEADISAIHFTCINSDFSFSSVSTDGQHTQFQYICFSNKECCLNLYKEDLGEMNTPISAWGKLFKKSIIGDLRFPLGRIHEDEYFIPLVCYKASKIAVSNAKLYYYRIAPESITHRKFSLKRYDDIWGIEQCIDFFSSVGEKEIVSEALRKKEVLICVYSLYARHDSIDIPKKFRRNWVTAIFRLHRKKKNSTQYYLSLISPKLSYWYECYRKISGMLISR